MVMTKNKIIIYLQIKPWMDYQETEYIRDFFTILKIYVWTMIISHIINIYSHTMHSCHTNQLTNKSLNSDFV